MKTIGQYQVLGLLGRGGMALVYKVAPLNGGPLLALKLLAPREELLDLLGPVRVRRLFTNEALALDRLSHPNLVSLRGLHLDEPQPYYLMDYYCRNLGQIIGETYQAEQPTRPLSLELALDLARQGLAGLAALHRAGIVHRDLKPFNLMLSQQGQVKIGDLGLSRLRGETRALPANLLVGSPWYAAPEQEAAPQGAGPTSDLFSLGVTLHRLLTGLLPSDQGPPASSLNPDLDPGWDAFLAQALQPDPARRFAKAEQMLAALEELASSWEARKEQVCRLADPRPALAQASQPPGRPRSEPIKKRPRQARQAFGLDRLWRPAYWPRADLRPAGQGALLHPASGLMWQSGGSPEPLSWPQAVQYVTWLNGSRLAGYNDWRLPTIDELATLLAPPPRLGDLCLPPAFDPLQDRLWSADRSSFQAAWYVSLQVGFVAWQDLSCPNYVRAVRSA